MDANSVGSPTVAVRTGSPWLAFTGLLPVLLMVPILLLHAYAVGVVVAVAGCIAVVGYHLARGQGLTSLDFLALVFAAANVVLYLGLGNDWLIRHVALIFYTVLAVQCLLSLGRREPWTMQFTRRAVDPQFWSAAWFREMNARTTALWGAAFVACDAATVLLRSSAATWLPMVVMAAAVVASRVWSRRFVAARMLTATP